MNPGAPLFSLSEDSQLLAALANPKRLEIVHLLADRKLRATEIYEMLDLPQANSSQHLAVLREAGIISVERNGRERFYLVANPRITELVNLVRMVTLHGESLPGAGSFAELVPLSTDPVCGMRISIPLSSFHSIFNGKTYHFCASGCLKKFELKPEQYV